MRITKIQIHLVVHHINRNIIDQSARLRLTIVRMTVMMIVPINDRNTRNDESPVNVVIHHTRNRVDRVSTLMIRNENDPFHVTEVVGVLIQARNINPDHALNHEIDDHIVISLKQHYVSIN